MTILNVFVNSERALIGVDTATSLKCKFAGHILKLHVLSHINAALSGRGHMMFGQMLYAECARHFGDFDELCARMPGFFAVALEEWLKLAVMHKVSGPLPVNQQEIVLVGWSPKLNRIVGMEYNQDVRKPGFSAGEINPAGYISGGDHESISRLPAKTKGDMVRLFRAQAELLGRVMPGMMGDSRLILCEIKHDGLTIESAADLGAP